MRGISFKAFFVGNLLSIAIPAITAFIIFIVAGNIQIQSGEHWSAAIETLKHEDWLINVVSVIASIGFVASGYIAASIAGKRFLLNAALASVLMMSMNVLDLFRTSTAHDTLLALLLSWSMTPFALLGGYLRSQAGAARTPSVAFRPGP